MITRRRLHQLPSFPSPAHRGRSARFVGHPFALTCVLATAAGLLVACGGGGDSVAADQVAATPASPSLPAPPIPPAADGGALPAVSLATGDLSKAMSKFPSTIGSVDFLLTDGKIAYAFGSSATDTSYARTVSTSADGITWSARKAMAGPQDPSTDYAINSKGVIAAHGCEFKAVNGFSVGVPYIRTSTDAVNWTERTLPTLTAQEVSNLCDNGGGNMYAVGDAFAVVGQYCTTLGSIDGSDWIMGSPSLNAGRTGPRNGCFLGFSAKGRLVIEHGTAQEYDKPSNTTKTYLFYSVTIDGIHWEQKRTFLNDKVAGVRAMAFLPNGEVRVSTQISYKDPAYQGLTIGDPSTIWSTTDLNTWTAVQTDVKGFVPYILNFEAAAKEHPQVVAAAGFQYVCDGTHLRSDINNLASSPDGVTFTTSSIFAPGGGFADGKNSCRKLIYLNAANRLIGTVSTATNVTSFFTSN